MATPFNPHGYIRLVCECTTCGYRVLCINNSDADMRKAHHEKDNKDHNCYIYTE